MIRLVSRMLKLPVSVFVSGLEILVRSMQDAQRTFEKGVDDVVREFVGHPDSNLDGAGPTTNGAKVDAEDFATKEKSKPSQVEEQAMYDDSCDPDLSGDGIKTITYLITFQKPDFETTLQGRRDETINYSTTARNFAGDKKMDFMNRLNEEGGIPYPSSWPDHPPDKGYTIEGVVDHDRRRPLRLTSIPAVDRHYIDVEIVSAFVRPKQDPQYDKQQVEVLRQIRDRMP
jgi:hypothetical protein